MHTRDMLLRRCLEQLEPRLRVDAVAVHVYLQVRRGECTARASDCLRGGRTRNGRHHTTTIESWEGEDSRCTRPPHDRCPSCLSGVPTGGTRRGASLGQQHPPAPKEHECSPWRLFSSYRALERVVREHNRVHLDVDVNHRAFMKPGSRPPPRLTLLLPLTHHLQVRLSDPPSTHRHDASIYAGHSRRCDRWRRRCHDRDEGREPRGGSCESLESAPHVNWLACVSRWPWNQPHM